LGAAAAAAGVATWDPVGGRCGSYGAKIWIRVPARCGSAAYPRLSFVRPIYVQPESGQRLASAELSRLSGAPHQAHSSRRKG